MFYYLAIFSLAVYTRLKFKVKVKGFKNIPKNCGLIFCSNHSSNFDPVMVCSSIRNRKIHYFAKKELFSTKFKNFWMRQLCAFPVDREGTDINALKFSINLLKGGGSLGIFAQGTRVKQGESAEAKNGVSLFALKSGVDVVPIGITANYEKKGNVIVNIGKPISFEKYKGEKPKTEILNKMTEEIMLEIEKLLNENK
ncbi:lysophospholipid acyltransferase family protein [uncultured Tyzzerella sp.]|uniref:lysophospholipid acyltransferase family protein n=1 Tax=uncultured Tyzzerella sp. TaxID=2321398 RepID=UPI002943B056|nr:lysophospholipid acyltransferase family protein [uncultured Tyzzerella sp.]